MKSAILNSSQVFIQDVGHVIYPFGPEVFYKCNGEISFKISSVFFKLLTVKLFVNMYEMCG